MTNSKDLQYYLDLKYPFTVRPDEHDGGYIVEFPDLRYCIGTGDTIADAVDDALISKQGWITTAYEKGIKIPEPTNDDEYSGRISLRIPKSLHKQINELARRDGVSANQYLSHLISMGIGKKI